MKIWKGGKNILEKSEISFTALIHGLHFIIIFVMIDEKAVVGRRIKIKNVLRTEWRGRLMAALLIE